MGPLSRASQVTHPSGRCQLTSNPRPDARWGVWHHYSLASSSATARTVVRICS